MKVLPISNCRLPISKCDFNLKNRQSAILHGFFVTPPFVGVAGNLTAGAFGPPELSRRAVLPVLVNAILFSLLFG